MGLRDSFGAEADGVAGTTDLVLTVDPTDSRKVYAGTNAGVFRSADAGATFVPLGRGLTHRAISALYLEPSGRVLHAATRGGGVFDLELLEDRWNPVRVPRPALPPRVIGRPVPSAR